MEKGTKERRVENLRKSLFGKRPVYIKKTNLTKLNKMTKEEEDIEEPISPIRKKQISPPKRRGSSKGSRTSKSASPFVKQTFVDAKIKGMFTCSLQYSRYSNFLLYFHLRFVEFCKHGFLYIHSENFIDL